MQEITFTNKYGNTVTFARGFPYMLEKISGTGTVESKPLTQRGFMQDGTHYFSSLLEPRELSLTLWIQGSSRTDLLGKRNEVLSAFNPKAGEGTLSYSNDAGTWEISATVKRLPQMEAIRNALVQRFTIEMYAADPAWLEAEAGEQEKAFTAFAGGLVLRVPRFDEEEVVVSGTETASLPFSFGTQGHTEVIDNEGNLDTPLLIEFKGPGLRHRLVNSDTGEKVELILPLDEGESVFVNTKPQSIEAYRMVNGKKVMAFNYLNPASKYFSIAPGTNNIMFSAAHSDATADVTYTERFVGV